MTPWVTKKSCPVSNKKKMITTGMLRQQVWMADDEFNYIVKNLQRLFGLNDQYEIHPYVEEFTKQYNVMFIYGTYALEGEAGFKIFFE